MEVSVGSVDIEEVSSNGKEVFRSLRSALELKSSVLAFALTFLKKMHYYLFSLYAWASQASMVPSEAR